MGLIKAGIGAVGGVLADQWKEFFYCDSLDNDTLMAKGRKRTSGRSSNTKGEDNIISNGSVIAVADGQAMMIVDQGKVAEFCAEPGEFIYDSSTEPSVFTGSLGKSIIDTFKTVGKRFSFGGDTGKDQRVYYFNTKEITGNRYGTQSPIPFKVVVNEQLGFKLSVDIRCNGEYSYKITDPMLFYVNCCGNVTESYDRDEIDSALKTDLMTALQPAFAKISARGIEYNEIPAHTFEIRDALNELLSKDWSSKRGISIFAFGVNSISIPDDQKKKITEWEEVAMTSNATIAGARLIGGQTEAMKAAAANENGAAMGFMGMGVAMNAGGMNAQNMFAMGQAQNEGRTPAHSAGAWKCVCGYSATGNFCPECGAKKPVQEGWQCACGAVNKGKFCPECGAKKPVGALLYRCDKCGWEPEDPTNPPKFCPECGDVFNENDAK